MNSSSVVAGCVTGIALALIGLLLLIVSTSAGVFFIVLGIISAIIGFFVKNKQEPSKYVESSTKNTDDANDEDENHIDEEEYADAGCRQLHTILVGTKYNNDDGTSRTDLIKRMSIGETVVLKPYLYKGDPAVAVMNCNGEMIGNMRKELADEFSNKIRNNRIGNVYLSGIRKEDGMYYCDLTINIFIH